MIALAFAVLGALWRRWFGGWYVLRRFITLPVAFMIGLAAAWPLDYQWAALVSFGLVLSWVPDHETDQFWNTLVRYSIAPFALAGILSFVGGFHWLLFAPAGLLISGAYWLAHRYPFKMLDNSMIDGSTCLAELFAGAVIYGGVALLAW